MIRNYKPEDIFEIEDIHAKSCDFPLPVISSPANVGQKTVEIDGKVVGSVHAHLTAEIVLILNKDLPTITRAKVIREMFHSLLVELEQTDLEDCHVFVKDEQFATLLQKNFDFVPDIGLGLCRGLKNE